MPSQRTVPHPALVSPYRADSPRRVTEVDAKAYRLFQARKAQGYTGGDELVKLAGRPRRA
jgi:hypothetical protein